jgi:hypothetical protein
MVNSTDDKSVSSNGSDDYSWPTSHAPSLSIDNLSTGKNRVLPRIKDFPALRVLIFKEPSCVKIPLNSPTSKKTPVNEKAPGVLAIRVGRMGNPSEKNMVLNEMDYTFVPSPATQLSDHDSRF